MYVYIAYNIHVFTWTMPIPIETQELLQSPIAWSTCKVLYQSLSTRTQCCIQMCAWIYPRQNEGKQVECSFQQRTCWWQNREIYRMHQDKISGVLLSIAHMLMIHQRNIQDTTGENPTLCFSNKCTYTSATNITLYQKQNTVMLFSLKLILQTCMISFSK